MNQEYVLILCINLHIKSSLCHVTVENRVYCWVKKGWCKIQKRIIDRYWLEMVLSTPHAAPQLSLHYFTFTNNHLIPPSLQPFFCYSNSILYPIWASYPPTVYQMLPPPVFLSHLPPLPFSQSASILTLSFSARSHLHVPPPGGDDEMIWR